MKLIYLFGALLLLTITLGHAEQLCDGRSPGYWKNNEGCHQGEGENPWASDLTDYSNGFSSVFTMTGTEICAFLDTNCGTDMNCKARWHLIALELDVVSGKLDPNANVIIEGDTYTIDEVIGLAESMIVDGDPDNDEDAKDLAYGAYSYYEPAHECEYNDIPEFGPIAGGLALIGAMLGIYYLRK